MAARPGTRAADPSVEELLAQQMQLVQQALAFNQQITARLARDKAAAGAAGSAGGGAAALRLPQPPGVKAIAALAMTALSPRNAPKSVVLPAVSESSELERPLLQTQTSLQSEQSTTSAVTPSRPASRLCHATTSPNLNVLAQSAASPGSMRLSQKSEQEIKERTPGPRSMFPTKEDMKRGLQDILNKPQYDVEDLYTEGSLATKIATNRNWQNATLMIIALNTIWIAIDTDYNKADVLCNAGWIFQVVDNFFCVWFVFEILSRFFAFEVKRMAFTDAWFVFDLTLVTLMVWETWIQVAMYLALGNDNMGPGGRSSSILRIFRIFRLTRVARMARLLRSVPELVVLVKGMAMAMRSVMATLALLILIIYIFAIMFTQLLGGTDIEGIETAFTSVPTSMDSLLMHGVFPEAREFIGSMLEAGPIYFTLIIMYLLLASCTVMNMLIGVLCEVVSVVAKVEQEEANVRDLEYQVKRIVGRIGRTDDFCVEDLEIDPSKAEISFDEFNKLKEDKETLLTLKELDVDIVALMDFGDFLFRDGKPLPMSSFLETVMQFRGGEQATVKDIVDMRKFICHEMEGLEVRLAKGHRHSIMP